MSTRPAVALRPPEKNEKPVRVAPMRKPPIPKFQPPAPASSNASEAYGASEAEASSARKKTPFVLYLQQRRVEGALIGLDATEAHNFLEIVKYPVKGQCSFASREDVKAAGAKWVPNPCFDKLQLRTAENVAGWWSAVNQDALRALLEVRDAKSLPAWRPLTLSHAAGERLLSLFRDFRSSEELHKSHKTDSDGKEREARTRAREMRTRFDLADIPDDSEHDVRRLRTEFAVVWTAKMAADSSEIPWLGPHAGVSAARRVLRAFDHGMLCADDVANDRWVDPDAGVRTRKAPKPDGESPESGLAFSHRGANAFMFGAGPGLRRLPCDAALRRSLYEWEQRYFAQAITRPQGDVIVRVSDCCCETCGTLVIDQFRECACLGRTWVPCARCTHLRCAEQPCGCGDAEWSERQRACRAKLAKLDVTAPASPRKGSWSLKHL